MSAQPPKRPTVTDVARSAGVHASTVSRALSPNDSHRISDEVAARVRAVAAALGYLPNGIAAGLRSGRTRLVGVVLPDIGNTVFAPILSGIEAVLDAHGYVMIAANAAGGPDRQHLIFERLAAHQVSGLILASAGRRDPIVAAIAARGLPLVLVNRSAGGPATSSVVSDDMLGMALAVNHLVALGHRRIGHAGGPATLSTGQGRRIGFLRAMAAAGLSSPAIAAATAYGRDEGRLAAAALFELAPGLTGIVAANDLIALGCIDALRERGRTCPGDVSVVGHNDMPMMDIVSPPLTTIRIRHREMGEQAAQLLLKAMAGESGARRIVLEPELVVRGSTSALETPMALETSHALDGTAAAPR